MAERAFPNVEVHYAQQRRPAGVVCQSARTARIDLGVLHDTEGGNIPHSSRDLSGLGTYFDKPSTDASSTVAVDEDANSARYVPAFRKAWAQVYYNSRALSIEQVGFANQSWQAAAKRPQLDEAARWIALWSHIWDLPIRHAHVTRDGRVTLTGWKQHRDLGVLGGGHTDVSSDYPLTRVLLRGRHFYKLQARDPHQINAIAHSRWERG